MMSNLLNFLVIRCKFCKKEKKISRVDYQEQKEIQENVNSKYKYYICKKCIEELEDI